MSIRVWLILAGWLSMLAACASTTHTDFSSLSEERAAEAADAAIDMLGKPYSYGGSTPKGFDCSGLVQYSFKRIGVTLPRDTQALLDIANPVSGELRRGDLLFFDQEGRKSSHVAIYLGDNRFVHAPSRGGRVRTDSLDAAYWKKHFVEARRM